MVCFVNFDLEMCFAPPRRAPFRHLMFEKGSARAVFSFFSSKCASRHNGVQLFISHLARRLRTRRFSESTFRPSGATNHWKNPVNRDFPTFSRTCIFFLLSLSLLWSSHFFSSPPWLFPPLLFHLSILSEVWLLNFLPLYRYIYHELNTAWRFCRSQLRDSLQWGATFFLNENQPSPVWLVKPNLELPDSLVFPITFKQPSWLGICTKEKNWQKTHLLKKKNKKVNSSM